MKTGQNIFPFLIVEKPSKSEKNKGCDILSFGSKRPTGVLYNNEEPNGFRDSIKAGNNYPTVKPLKLFLYLITIGSREEDTILDPFLGSGTVLRACRLLNRNGIGYELNAEYENIIKGRSMSHTPPLQSWAE